MDYCSRNGVSIRIGALAVVFPIVIAETAPKTILRGLEEDFTVKSNLRWLQLDLLDTYMPN